MGLAEFVEKHREAVERDLLVETGHELDDIGRTLSWSALGSFLSKVKIGSALGDELNPEISQWATVVKTNSILADIYDQLSLVNENLRVIITHKPPRMQKPYPRPGAKNKKEKHIGNAPLPVTEMKEWIKKHQRR